MRSRDPRTKVKLLYDERTVSIYSIVKRLGDMTQIYSASSARVLPRQASCSGGMSASSRRTRRR